VNVSEVLYHPFERENPRSLRWDESERDDARSSWAAKYEISLFATKMLSAFRYRLYPRPWQEKRLDRSLLLLCKLYNDLKAEEIRRYKEEHKSTSKTRFRRLALEARKRDNELQTVHCQAVQNVGDRIHRSFTNFFEARSRFPRWKKSRRYNSLTYPQSGFKMSLEKGLHLSGIGDVRIFVHGPLLGKVKRSPSSVMVMGGTPSSSQSARLRGGSLCLRYPPG
jgi:hypothetical protein